MGRQLDRKGLWQRVRKNLLKLAAPRVGRETLLVVDAATGLTHTVVTAPANEHDVTRDSQLLHGGESQVSGDSGYQGVENRSENRDPPVQLQVMMKPGKRWRLPPESEAVLAERRKASVWAEVEHMFLYLKRHFGYAKVRYRGLAKNSQWIYLLVGFVNLMIAERSGVTA